MSALLNSLTDAEMMLVRETDRDQMSDLDEDGLVELHGRIRRARDKYVKLYRREAAAKVGRYGGRGVSRPKNQRNAGKAEIFEDALARISRKLAAAARRSAAELKSERIAASRRNSPGPQMQSRNARNTREGRLTSQTLDRSPNSPALRKRQASTLATGARRQAKKDYR
jgi:hypothetical protein